MVTALPLLLFAAAAQRLPLVTMGLLFYLTPAMQLTWGVVVGHEPMPVGRWIGFALIWVALVVFSCGRIVAGPCRSGIARIVIRVMSACARRKRSTPSIR